MSQTLEYSNNSIIIRGVDFDSTEFEKFHKSLSTWDKVTHKYTNSLYHVYNKDIYIPRSLGIEYVKYYFPKLKETENPNLISKARDLSYNMVNQPRDDVQKSAINFITQVTSDTKTSDRFLTLNTGDGKTFTTIFSISNIQKVPMIIVDATDLANQWKKEFLNHTDLKASDIMILSGKDSLKKAVTANRKAKVYIAMHRTLQMVIQDDPANIAGLFNKLGIGVRVFDECHLEFHNICRINSFSNVMYSIYLTATANRAAFNENKMYVKIFGSMRTFNGKIRNNTRYHNIYKVEMNTKPDIKQSSRMQTQYGFSMPRWATYLMEERYETLWDTITWLLERLKVKENQMITAIVLPSIDLIKKVHKDLEKHLGMKVGLFIGEIPKKKRETELKRQVIVTNQKIFGKGVDVKGLECMLVYSSVSSDNNIEQLIGRIRYGEEKRHIYADITDHGFPQLVKHYNSRKTFYNKTAKMIVECEEKFNYDPMMIDMDRDS